MAENLTENFNELCRLCASKINLLVALNIFQGDGEISKKISSCLPIQVHETDRLPKLICSECIYKLDICFDFHEKCLDTENFFFELEKIKESKDIERRSIELVDSPQIQIVRNPEDLLEHPNMSIPHELADRENMIVNQQIIINSHSNITIHNHELDNIEISPHELNSHGLTHGNMHPQQLDLHHEPTMAQLVQPQIQIPDPHISVQNLDLIHSHSQHNLINNHYETIHSKNDNSVGNDINITLGMKEQQNVTPVKVEEIKESEDNLIMVKTMYSDTSDSDETLEPDFESNVNEGSEDKLERNNLYKDNKQFHLNSPDTELNTSKSVQDHVRNNMKNSLDDNFFKEESSDEENNATRDNSEFNIENDEEDNEDADNNEDSNRNTKRKRWEPKICKECGKSYKTNYKLAEHMRKHTGEQPFKCSTCDKAFRSKIGLAQHEAKHTGQYDYACPTCGKGFQCKSYLIVHQRVHSNLKPFPCSQCGRNFKTKQSLLDHMNRHLGVKPYMCEICGRGFITKGLCKSHQKVHSGRDNRQYPCTICNKLFVSKSYLATHLRIHTGEKPFMCEVCGKGFLTRVDLRIHSTMHTGEKSFVCEICGKAFARRDALRCHRRSHTGERPYRCDICGQTFTQFSPMAIHKRLHTGERPYSCEVCNKTFVSRSTMMSHRKKHAP